MACIKFRLGGQRGLRRKQTVSDGKDIYKYIYLIISLSGREEEGRERELFGGKRSLYRPVQTRHHQPVT